MNIIVYFGNLIVIHIEATRSSLRFHYSQWNIISAWSPNPFASVIPEYIFIPYNNQIYQPAEKPKNVQIKMVQEPEGSRLVGKRGEERKVNKAQKKNTHGKILKIIEYSCTDRRALAFNHCTKCSTPLKVMQRKSGIRSESRSPIF